MELRELGLTVNEAKVYEVMLRLGKSTAGNICKEAQVPYGRIYTILESLEEKGFVRVIPEKTKYYIPTNPEKLREIIDKKIKDLMEIDNKVKELKIIYDENTEEPVLIAKGKSNFHKISKEAKNPEKYSYSIKYSFSLDPSFIRGTKKSISKEIDVKTLGRVDTETEKSVKEWLTIHRNVKHIPNEGVAISIVDDNEIVIGLIKSNTTILIRDKPFVKLMKELFIKYYAYTDAPEIK